MHNAPLSLLIIYCPLKTPNSRTVTIGPIYVCMYDVFDSKSGLELNPEVVTLTRGTPCIYSYVPVITFIAECI
jgi:hypothetical protein